jgi:hypothetical protein
MIEQSTKHAVDDLSKGQSLSGAARALLAKARKIETDHPKP